MSRNKEKAQSALNRYHQETNKQAGVLQSNPNDRPKYVQSVESLPQAEQWRKVVITEISTRLTRIEDPMLGEDQVRELNETLNKLFKEKRAWEHHIKTLGGPDYIRFGPNLQASGMVGDEISGIKGFRYFGRAKQLPEVLLILKANKDKYDRESTQKIQEKTKADDLETRFSKLSSDYYTYFGTPGIVDAEDELFTSLGQPYTRRQEVESGDTFRVINAALLEKIKSERKAVKKDVSHIQEYEPPSADDIKTWIVKKKKEELLAKISR